MFTGLISDIGILKIIAESRLTIECHYDAETILEGASIACDGCCLTAINIAKESDTLSYFDVDVSNETKDCTTLKNWQKGQRINLERSLKIGDELGGHIVSGHVDGVGNIIDIKDDDDSKRFVFSAPDNLKQFIASKGSIALNGTSLTVNEVDGEQFEVNIIPHTLAVTNWSDMSVGDLVNIEIDMLARYVARLHSVNISG